MTLVKMTQAIKVHSFDWLGVCKIKHYRIRKTDI